MSHDGVIEEIGLFPEEGRLEDLERDPRYSNPTLQIPHNSASDTHLSPLEMTTEEDLESGSLAVSRIGRSTAGLDVPLPSSRESNLDLTHARPRSHRRKSSGPASIPPSPSSHRTSSLMLASNSITASKQSVRWSQDLEGGHRPVESKQDNTPDTESLKKASDETDTRPMPQPTVLLTQPSNLEIDMKASQKNNISLLVPAPEIIKTALMSPLPDFKPISSASTSPNPVNAQGADPFHNPFNDGATLTQRKKRSGTPLAQGGRRMSLGAALCIPPPPRIDHNMSARKVLKLSLGALGIIYGDIAVSPLFVLKTIFSGEDHSASTEHGDEHVLGALSFLIWIVTLVCCVKYIWLILKADKNGEGGTWALISLLPTEGDDSVLAKYRKYIYVLGLLAASFIVADAVIAPAITVLAAFEGVKEYASSFSAWGGVGCTCAILTLVFYVQRFGTSSTQKFYGPIFVVWFLTIAMIGLYNISQYPKVFAAISPHYLGLYIQDEPLTGFFLLSHVVLAMAGVEALYADLGHFSALPIRLSFLGVVYPSIMLSYIGQAAYVILHPEAARDPFFHSVPSAVKWPVLVIATMAAILAAQGAITGCVTLIDQSISFNAFPNIKTKHPSIDNGSEVYIPFVNFLLWIGSISLTLAFQSSEGLANIAGICISGSMTVTSFLYGLVMLYGWNLPRWKVALYAIVFWSIDLLLFASSMRKVTSMGWVSLLIAMFIFLLMYTWYVTTREVNDWLHDRLLAMSELRQHVKAITRTHGTVVFVSNTDEDVPNVLNICARRLNSLPMNIVCMTAVSQPAPFVADEEKTVFRTIDAMAGIYRLVISYGYAERSINVVSAMERAKKRGLRMAKDDKVVFIVGRELIQSGEKARWLDRIRRALYDTLSRNTQGKIDYYNLPHDATLEMASYIVLDPKDL
ncbi:uncharacterized protein SPPG_05061 [Spizellomyces punctatus DAOM BR117]|uniref:Potassium transporter n=1 Tax=Spizellomyces punctatus (strain DAOM BR117) TaxID=645134 RepID=A0A0L0HFJ1_SPIPD|nr:uncharacterized protein SPPG_05061 [Spizellomyces punctatus DAOM BR117]KNC99679.1 hypothetical protein SPPG_05061 [Spizellomyces punctatus DAOM BR117]|eukprot:XP_016607719.1 hypothetical protein SPPG_05061 [Spizellomyces punctatus DAOM BR117]